MNVYYISSGGYSTSETGGTDYAPLADNTYCEEDEDPFFAIDWWGLEVRDLRDFFFDTRDFRADINLKAIRAEHNNHFPRYSPTLRRRHCRKEILRKHDRQFPAIQAQLKAKGTQ